MILEVRQIGNSAAVIIPKKMLESINLSIGDKVDANNVTNGILLEPVRMIKKYKLKDLLLLCNKDNMIISSKNVFDLKTDEDKNHE